MTPSTIVNSVGLVLDIVGAVLVFMFGLPADISRSGAGHLLLEGTDESEIARAKKYDRWARVGLISLILGFVFQLVSNFI